MAQKVRLVPLA
jgi:hypothetical protein